MGGDQSNGTHSAARAAVWKRDGGWAGESRRTDSLWGESKKVLLKFLFRKKGSIATSSTTTTTTSGLVGPVNTSAGEEEETKIGRNCLVKEGRSRS